MITDSPDSTAASPARPSYSRGLHLRRLCVAGAAAVIALLVSTRAPFMGPLLVALLLGVFAANTPGVARHVVDTSPRLDKWLLRTGITLLGLRVVLEDVLALGLRGLTIVLVTVAATYVATLLAGRALGVPRELTILVAAGFSICGAAAIAAVESSIRAKARDVALAIALVTVFGSAVMVAVPAAAHVLGLTSDQSAIWAGASIHEVAQVVTAASLLAGGSAVLAAATTVKLARVMLLVPVQLVSAKLCQQEGVRSGPLVPAFIVGFLAAVAVRATGQMSEMALSLVFDVTTFLLAAAMFGLGTTVVARQLWPVPARAVVLATISTVVAAGVSLTLVGLLV